MAFNPLSIFSGPSPLPPQVGTVTGQYAPATYAQGQADIAQGQALTTQGQALYAGGESALAMAQAGQLTPEQQAQLNLYTTGLKNTAIQTYEAAGFNPNKSTSFISTEADIAQKSLAMASSFIANTIQLAGAEFTAGSGLITAGGSFTSLGQQAEDAATKDLLATAQMQVAQDNAYSKLIGDTLGSIAKIFAAPGVAAGAGSFLSSLMPGGGTYEGNINTAANPSFS